MAELGLKRSSSSTRAKAASPGVGSSGSLRFPHARREDTSVSKLWMNRTTRSRKDSSHTIISEEIWRTGGTACRCIGRISSGGYLPHFATWQSAIRWLRDAQVATLHGDTDGEAEKGFESQEASIFCAVAQVTRNPSRKPWDLVEEQHPQVNRLLHAAHRPSKEDDWT